MWLLNSYKVTITDVVKNCQEKIELLAVINNKNFWHYPLLSHRGDHTPRGFNCEIVPIQKWLFQAISVLDLNSNPRNTPMYGCMSRCI